MHTLTDKEFEDVLSYIRLGKSETKACTLAKVDYRVWKKGLTDERKDLLIIGIEQGADEMADACVEMADSCEDPKMAGVLKQRMAARQFILQATIEKYKPKTQTEVKGVKLSDLLADIDREQPVA
jgi:hypothetical protein